MKTRKKTLMLSVIASLFVTVLAVAPVYAQGTTLAAPDVFDESLGPGSSFSIDITVADVSAMWGYDFFLSYDPGMLTATNFGFYDPFVTEFPSEINVAEGYVALARGMEIMEPFGFDTVDPAPVAWIDFTVNDIGWSALDLYNSVVSDVYADPIDHELDDGLFINILAERSANLVRRSAWPEHHSWVESKDENQTLTGKVKGLGNVPLTVKVVFTISKKDSAWSTSLETPEAMIVPGKPGLTDLTRTITFADLDGYGGYYVSAQCWYDSDGDHVPDSPGTKVKKFSFAFKP